MKESVGTIRGCEKPTRYKWWSLWINKKLHQVVWKGSHKLGCAVVDVAYTNHGRWKNGRWKFSVILDLWIMTTKESSYGLPLQSGWKCGKAFQRECSRSN